MVLTSYDESAWGPLAGPAISRGLSLLHPRRSALVPATAVAGRGPQCGAAAAAAAGVCGCWDTPWSNSVSGGSPSVSWLYTRRPSRAITCAHTYK
jgi:hypothetical protein